VTCLVGKNKLGKTNLLQALLRLNPAEPRTPLDEVLDYPARLTRERRQAPAGADLRGGRDRVMTLFTEAPGRR